MKLWYCLLILALICVISLGCGSGEEEITTHPVVSQVAVTRAKGVVAFSDAYTHQDIGVEVRSESGSPVPDQRVHYLTDGERFLIITTDIHEQHLPNLHEGLLADVPVAAADQSSEPATIVLTVSSAGPTHVIGLDANPPVLLKGSSLYAETCWGTDDLSQPFGAPCIILPLRGNPYTTTGTTTFAGLGLEGVDGVPVETGLVIRDYTQPLSQNTPSLPVKWVLDTCSAETFDQPQSILARDGAPMRLIPAGEFEMGDSSGGGASSEGPIHTVYLDAFYIDVYEVTNARYAEFLNDVLPKPEKWLNFGKSVTQIESDEQGYLPVAGYGEYPVIGISWEGAGAYCEWAGKRLPTEAEWEKAARGSLNGKRYPWGDEISHEEANYNGVEGRDVWGGLAPIGRFPPNGYGLYDVVGNAWEWCADWYDADYYINSPVQNPPGPNRGDYRVLRGGSWSMNPYSLRVSFRCWYPDCTSKGLGFRCAMDAD